MNGQIRVFEDRDGDVLSVSARNSPEGKGLWDPFIHINHPGFGTLGVVFIEDEAPDIIAGIVRGLNLDVSKLYNIIGKVQDIIDQKENANAVEHVTDGSPCPCGPMVETFG